MNTKFDLKSIIIKSKEKRRDAVYAIATIIIIGLTSGLFIWSVNVVLRAVDAAFIIGAKEDISSEILAFNIKGFAQIAPLLGVNFNSIEKTTEISPVVAPSILEPPVETLSIETSTSSAVISTSTATSIESE